MMVVERKLSPVYGKLQVVSLPPGHHFFLSVYQINMHENRNSINILA